MTTKTSFGVIGPIHSEVIGGEAFAEPFFGAMGKVALAVGNMTDKTGGRSFEERRRCAISWLKQAIENMESGPQHTPAESWAIEEWENRMQFRDSWHAEARATADSF